MKLPYKQKLFVDYYDGNGSAAAILAGYSEKASRQIATRLLTKAHIKEAIKRRDEKRNLPKIASRAERQSFWSHTMRDESQEMRDRNKASELLGRSEADFTDNQNIILDDKFLDAIRQTDTNRLREIVCQLN